METQHRLAAVVLGGKCQFLRAELGWRHLLLTPSSFRAQTELLPSPQSAQEGQAGQVLASTSASFPSLRTHLEEWERVSSYFSFKTLKTQSVFVHPLPYTIAGNLLIFLERLSNELEIIRL